MLDEGSRDKFKTFLDYLNFANNGRLDLDSYLNSEYGAELLRRLKIRFAIEDDVEASNAYFASLGLQRETHEWDDYYTRWTLLTPGEKGRAYPLLFWNHGGNNSIECEECMLGFAELAAREGFMLVLAQNTNPENILRILDILKGRGIVDQERVYIGGFSQGGSQAQGAYHHHPEVFAACVTSGNDILRPWDNFDQVYTEEELARLRALTVPLIQFMGVCEPSLYAPLNDWAPRVFLKDRPKGDSDTFVHPGKNAEKDPTRIRVPNPEPGKPGWRMSKNYNPGPEDAVGPWCMAQTNTRLAYLDCEPRDEATCLGYLSAPEDDVHRRTGIYGDYEAVETHYGYKHYIAGVNNRAGEEVYRVVVVENSPHWPQLSIGELGWQFLKRFRRDKASGRLVVES